MKTSITKFKNRLKPLNVHSVEGYFAIPKKDREFCGIYLKPYALPSTILDDDVKGWEFFEKEIRRIYPVQGFIREWLFTYDNPVYAFVGRFFEKCKDLKYAVKRLIKPYHPRWRKIYPRYSYMDIHYAIEEINLAFILDFWYEEVVDKETGENRFVCEEDNGKRKEIYLFLRDAVNWIEVEKKDINKMIEAEWLRIHKIRKDKTLTYEQKFGEVNRLEKFIRDRETEIIKKLVEYREYLWT